MSKPHHSPANEAAMHEADAHNLAAQRNAVPDAIPAAEHGSHPQSPAAHLGSETQPDTKPQGNLRHGFDPGSRNEPPMVVQREGKQHRD